MQTAMGSADYCIGAAPSIHRSSARTSLTPAIYAVSLRRMTATTCGAGYRTTYSSSRSLTVILSDDHRLVRRRYHGYSHPRAAESSSHTDHSTPNGRLTNPRGRRFRSIHVTWLGSRGVCIPWYDGPASAAGLRRSWKPPRTVA